MNSLPRRVFSVEVVTAIATFKIECDDEQAIARAVAAILPNVKRELDCTKAEAVRQRALIETPDYIPQKQAVAIRVNGAERKVPACVARVAALYAKGERRQRIRPETIQKLTEYLPELRAARDCTHKIVCNRAMFTVEAT